jgi:hypothetical protein
MGQGQSRSLNHEGSLPKYVAICPCFIECFQSIQPERPLGVYPDVALDRMLSQRATRRLTAARALSVGIKASRLRSGSLARRSTALPKCQFTWGEWAPPRQRPAA